MNKELALIIGLVIPFLGTMLGAAMVYILKKEISIGIKKLLLGFASGVMVSAAVWSLLIPSIDMASGLYTGALKMIPAVVGFFIGILFLYLLDNVTPHQHIRGSEPEGPKSAISKTTKLFLAVTIHNIPEGMAMGIILAAFLTGETSITTGAAISLAIGIAIQNFPEGAIVSMPFEVEGNSRTKSFILGMLSGLVEPVAAVLMILLKDILMPIMPYLLSFASGAMIYVVIEELLPESYDNKHSNMPTFGFAFGFILMMVLDVIFG